MLDKFNEILKHPLVDTCLKIYKKIKSSTNYWVVVSPIILTLIQQVFAILYGEAIVNYGIVKLEDTNFNDFWEFIIYIFDIGGSYPFLFFFFIVFSILTYVKLKESKEISNEGLSQIDKKISDLHIKNEKEFLKEYFGEDWKKAFLDEQTYHNLKKLLIENENNTQKLLDDKKELEEKIKANRLNDAIQKQIDKAFNELRFDDVRILLDTFIEKNKDIESDLIKAHYQKALSYIEEIKFKEAKNEFEQYIPSGIKDSSILDDYGTIYHILGQYDKAIEYFEKNLMILKENKDENYPYIATSYCNLGVTLEAKGEYDKAIDYYEKSIKIRKKIFGETSPITAASYSNIAVVWNRKGKYDKAIDYNEKALKIRERFFGENHSYTATSYNNLGLDWSSKDEHEKAIEYYQKALKIRYEIFGENHPDTATSYSNVGLVFKKKGEYDKAIEYYEKALKIRREIFGENHPDTAISYNNLSLAWECKGNHKKAKEFIGKTVEIYSKLFPKGHPHLDIFLNNQKDIKLKIK